MNDFSQTEDVNKLLHSGLPLYPTIPFEAARVPPNSSKGQGSPPRRAARRRTPTNDSEPSAAFGIPPDQSSNFEVYKTASEGRVQTN